MPAGFRLLLICLAALLGLGLAACLPPRPFDEAAWQREVAAQRPADLHAPHRQEDGRFFNPWQPLDRPAWDILTWLLTKNSLAQEPAEPTPVEANDGAYLADPAAPPSLTWIGHATFALQWTGQVVVTDPFFSQRALFVKRRVPPAFGPEKIPAGAVALISHNHPDHLDGDSVAALGGRVTFLCPLGLKELLGDMGAAKVTELDWWQSVEVDGTRFTCLPAQHWSRRLNQGFNRSLWCTWLMERGGRRVFFAGDTGYFVGFKEFGRLWPGLDLAILPLGASQPRWFMHYVHMDAAEALTALDDLGAKRMVPGHWGVIKLGDEPPSWPLQDLRARLQGRPELAARVRPLPVGGRLALE